MPYNDDSIALARSKYIALQNTAERLHICHLGDPLSPVLTTELHVNGNPRTYRTYGVSNPLASNISGNTSDSENILLDSRHQLRDFVNAVFIPYDDSMHDFDTKVYTKKHLSLQHIYESVKPHTSLFQDSMNQFKGFVSHKPNGIGFVAADRDIVKSARRNSKKAKSDSTIRLWSLLVLKEHFKMKVKNAIYNYMDDYKYQAEHLKREGYRFIGYARKSSQGDISLEARFCSFERMVRKLKLLLAEDIYVSPCSVASADFHQRDNDQRMTDYKEILNIDGVKGNTNALLSSLRASTQLVVLIVIDYAGLSTDQDHVFNLVREHNQLAYLYVDRSPVSSTIESYSREELMSDPKILSKFNCRPPPVRRSVIFPLYSCAILIHGVHASSEMPHHWVKITLLMGPTADLEIVEATCEHAAARKEEWGHGMLEWSRMPSRSPDYSKKNVVHLVIP
ncbi:predicted protein [Lichtheimia corymbifera JMRC:FSU:9682]|uniref:Uncharacterized protein n=1 Tax=Lichtheimia corymbifera JMRC:FSU:9682 TaxID=1263082 RepID=A0A068SGE5_9FUNG|nr:predicted protein [Lichtheimia corymbifera JMRC:FSU:9682]